RLRCIAVFRTGGSAHGARWSGFCAPRRFQGQGKMISAVVEPDHAFAMVSTNDLSRLQAGGKAQEGIWGFTLEPSQPGQTRLIARLRGGTPPTLGARLGRLFWKPAHFVIERGCCGAFGIWPRKAESNDRHGR